WLTDRIETQIDQLMISGDGDRNRRAAAWTEHKAAIHRVLRRQYGKNRFTLDPTRNPNGLTNAINNYIAGELTAIDVLPVQTAGTTFQRQVWRALREISCGTTVVVA